MAVQQHVPEEKQDCAGEASQSGDSMDVRSIQGKFPSVSGDLAIPRIALSTAFSRFASSIRPVPARVRQ